MKAIEYLNGDSTPHLQRFIDSSFSKDDTGYKEWLEDCSSQILKLIKDTDNPNSIYYYGDEIVLQFIDSIHDICCSLESSIPLNDFKDFYCTYVSTCSRLANDISSVQKNDDYVNKTLLWIEYNLRLSYIHFLDLGYRFDNNSIKEYIDKEIKDLLDKYCNDGYFSVNCELTKKNTKDILDNFLLNNNRKFGEFAEKDKKKIFVPLIVSTVMLIIALIFCIQIPMSIARVNFDVKKVKFETQSVDIIDNGPSYTDRYSIDISVLCTNKTKGDIISMEGIIYLADRNNNKMFSVNVLLPRINSGDTLTINIPISLQDSNNLENVFSNLDDTKLCLLIYRLDYNSSEQSAFEDVNRTIVLKTFDESSSSVNKAYDDSIDNYEEPKDNTYVEETTDDIYSDIQQSDFHVEYVYDEYSDQVGVYTNTQAYYYENFGEEIGWITPKTGGASVYQQAGLFDSVGSISEKCVIAYYDVQEYSNGTWYCISEYGNEWVVSSEVDIVNKE